MAPNILLRVSSQRLQWREGIVKVTRLVVAEFLDDDAEGEPSMRGLRTTGA